jgi:hypothetical protein
VTRNDDLRDRFVIVVLGVFLGLQAQQWSDDRKETAQLQR